MKFVKLDPDEKGATLTRRLTINSNRKTSTIKGQLNATQGIPEEKDEEKEDKEDDLQRN